LKNDTNKPTTNLFGEELRCKRCNQRLSHCICHTPKKWKNPRERRESKERRRADDKLARQIKPIEPHELKFRHGHWLDRRAKVLEKLKKFTHRQSIIERFENCGTGSCVQWSESLKRHRLTATYCKNKHCEPCMRAKANKIAANLRTKLGTGTPRQFRFITLTLKHSDAPLREQVQRLYKSFKSLRGTKFWKRSQDGGVFTLEVKLVEPTGAATTEIGRRLGHEWHPHLHVISDGRWISKQELSIAWKQITGDSEVVDVAAVDRGKDVAAYVCKYITKGTSPEVWDTDELAAAWLDASKGVRTCATYGNWRGFALCASTEDAKDWEFVGWLGKLICAARSGDQIAYDILTSLRPEHEEQAHQLIAE